MREGSIVLVAGFAAGAFAANCYVVAARSGEECVVVDPGEDAAAGVAALVAEHQLRPVAVVLTHGHLDHVWSAAQVCATYAVPCWIHPADRHLLSDPLAGLPAEWAAAVPLAGGLAEPADVRPFAATPGQDDRLQVAALDIRVVHTPGHTPGSVVCRLRGDDGGPELMLAGDLLFAGSVGRTDLPGGDHETMRTSLASRVLPLDDETVVLPGHGGRTTVGREKASNPYLQDLETVRP